MEAIKFFEALVKLLFHHGSVVFDSMMDSNWSNIDKLHGNFLRSICAVPSRCSYERLIDQLHLNMLSADIISQAEKIAIGLTSCSPFGQEWSSVAAVKIDGKSIIKIPSVALNEMFLSPMLRRAMES